MFRTKWVIAGILIALYGAIAHAQTQTFELGPFGEITTWLVGYAPSMPLEQDPLQALGGEAKFATMGDPKFAPFGGRSLDLPGPKPGDKVPMLWQIARMVMPEYPNIWMRHPHLNVLLDKDGHGFGGNAYCYCRLISPRDQPASLIGGLGSFGQGRFYLNGKDLGYAISNQFWESEDIAELPIELKKGVNHLLIRIPDPHSLSCRLVGLNAEPLKAAQIQFDAIPNAPVAPGQTSPSSETFTNLAAQMPTPAPAEHPEILGAKIARTMSLLESGKFTHRPVRIMFYGQSIETAWTSLLIQRLHERYPGTTIVSENRALGGWVVPRLMKTLKHDILRWQPDLVLFHAYGGTPETWERFLSDLRRETTADIVIRTAHLAVNGGDTLDGPPDNTETVTLRRLAQKYDVELVELRAEWLNYLRTNHIEVKDMLADSIHLNPKGHTLMALLYERHFRYNALSRPGWANTVRRFDVMRFLEERKTDEIVLAGASWQKTDRGFAQSDSPKDVLKLKFVGTRVDLVLPPGQGVAAILIDGKKPSQWHLFHGTLPFGRTRAHYNYLPDSLMTYHLGKDMREETWVLTFTHSSTNKLHARFKLTGSVTGVDGEGDTDHDFVSASKRITILAEDWFKADERGSERNRAPATQPVLEPLPKPGQLVWYILPDSMDTVHGDANPPPNRDYYSVPYNYVTIFDGLPCGLHELTLTPLAATATHAPFAIMGLDVHCPPMARDITELTRPRS